jgi:4-hydroxy-2-oxoheptanedioate aldolase
VGGRSYGPVRAGIRTGAEYYRQANETTVAIPMIETRQGLENLESILDVPGVDAIFVGPSDLSQSLGMPVGPEWTDGVVYDALAHIASTCASRGVPAGVFTNSTAYARRMLDLGFRFVTAGSDLAYVKAGAAAAVAELTEALG